MPSRLLHLLPPSFNPERGDPALLESLLMQLLTQGSAPRRRSTMEPRRRITLLLTPLVVVLAITVSGSECASLKADPPPLGVEVQRKGGRPDRLFVFGDSIVDTGNNNYITTDLTANFPPYGMNYINASGRWSDGKILPDFIADYMGISAPPASLAVLAQGLSTASGVNFASGGAGILNETVFNRTIPLYRQLDIFHQFLQSGKITQQDIARGIFLVNVGANDIFFLPSGFLDLAAYVAKMAKGYANFLKALSAAGARRFILLSIPPVGCVPYARALSANGTCNDLANFLIGGYNAIEDAATLTAGLPRAKIVFYDLFGSVSRLLNNYKKLGYSSINACCGAPPPINGIVQCGREAVINGTTFTATVCSDPQNYFFWDLLHPTQAATKFLAGEIWHGSAYTFPWAGAKTLLRH